MKRLYSLVAIFAALASSSLTSAQTFTYDPVSEQKVEVEAASNPLYYDVVVAFGGSDYFIEEIGGGDSTASASAIQYSSASTTEMGGYCQAGAIDLAGGLSHFAMKFTVDDDCDVYVYANISELVESGNAQANCFVTLIDLNTDEVLFFSEWPISFLDNVVTLESTHTYKFVIHADSLSVEDGQSWVTLAGGVSFAN